MASRFHGPKAYTAATLPRIICRINEFVFCLSALQFDGILKLQLLLPSFVMVCCCRSQEFFCIWKELKNGSVPDHAEEGFDRLDQILTAAFESSEPLQDTEWSTHLRQHLQSTGVCKHLARMTHTHIHMKGWDQGSGVVRIAILCLLAFSSSIVLNSNEKVRWKILLCCINTGVFVVSLNGVLPACIVRLDRGFQHIKQSEPLVDILQMSWFKDIKSFIKDLIADGLPLGTCYYWWEDEVRKFEALELIIHVICFGIVRFIARSFLVGIVWLLKVTSFGLKLETIWSAYRTNIAIFVVNHSVAVADLMKARRVIINTEAMLGSERKCGCIILKQELPTRLQRAMEEQDPSVIMGMFQSTSNSLKELNFTESNAWPMRPVLHLLDFLKRCYIGAMQYDQTVAQQIVDEMEGFSKEHWQISCGDCKDMPVIKVKFQVCMLIRCLGNIATDPESKFHPEKQAYWGGVLESPTTALLFSWLKSRSRALTSALVFEDAA